MIGKGKTNNDTGITRSLSPIAVWALSFGCAVGWGAFIMPGTTFLPLAGPLGTVIGILCGMAIMLIIGLNYSYMINHYPDAGGVFSFVRKVLGYDHGFLCAWFIALAYISIAWANATALPLIFRHLFGDIFMFGFHYSIAGYEIYISEACLSLLAMGCLCYICYHGGKMPGILQIIFAVVMLGGICIGVGAVFLHGHPMSETFEPPFSPTSQTFRGVINVIALSPWAFVGFESVSNAAEEYAFPTKRILRIIIVAVCVSAFSYAALTLIASSVHPDGYSNWSDYISDLDHIEGVASAPVFYAVRTLMGDMGIVIFCVTLLGAVFTGILGNFFAVSRMLFAMQREHMMPMWIDKTDGKHIPHRIFLLLMIISLPIPFFGRSVIGWIVDVSTIGAAIAYFYVSLVTYITAKKEKNNVLMVTGYIGSICAVSFFLYFMIPHLSAVTTLSTESYLILVIWSILGFMFFHYLFKMDNEWRFGNSTVVWVFLLFLIFFTTTLWTRQASHKTTHEVVDRVVEHHVGEFGEHGVVRMQEEQKETEQFLEGQMEIVNQSLMNNSMIQMGLMSITLLIFFSLYTLIVDRQKKATKELLKAKSDFLANMSHEIRTPINTILGMDEMILRESNEKDVRKYASDIQHAGKMLISLINDVLDFSRIEAGKLELVPDEYDLKILLLDIIDIIRIRADKKGLILDMKVDENMPHILYGDNIRLQQILFNLLTNAVKYTESGRIDLRVTYTKEDDDSIMMYISVQDTGIGIKEEDLERLFVAFERFDEGRNRTVEGTGLGMNIVNQLLELMDSRLNVESVYGEGSKFSFAIRQKVLDWTPVGELKRNGEEEGELSETYHVSFVAPDAQVLIVDDTEMNLLVIRGLLKNTYLQIDTAEDGKEALEMAQKKEYDLLLVDHRMPVMDGIEMITTLRTLSDNPNSHKPCICLTANAVAGAREEYIEAGFDDYMVKPVNGSRLESMLVAYLPKDKVKCADAMVQSDGKGTATREETAKDTGSEHGDGSGASGAEGASGAAGGSDPREVDESRGEEPVAQEPPVFADLRAAGIDTKEGLEYSGSTDMYIMALQFFRNTADAKCDEIRGYYESGDWKNYTTKVHGLKSSARVIGASELSEHARLLEMAGKGDDLDYIHSNHEALMEEFASYKVILKDV